VRGRSVLLALALLTLALLLWALEELLAATLLGLLLTLLPALLLSLLLGLLLELLWLLSLLPGLLLELLWLLSLLPGLSLELLGLLLGHLLLATHLLSPLAADELAARATSGHLVWLLGLTVRGLELARYLLWAQALCTLGTGPGRVLRRQADLLVDLTLLLFTLLSVSLWFLDELAGLWVSRLEFGLDGFVLAERLRPSSVADALLLSVLLLSLLALLTVLWCTLVTHSLSAVGGRCARDTHSLGPTGIGPSGGHPAGAPGFGTNVADPVGPVGGFS